MTQRGARPEHEPGVDVLTSPGARAWAATAPAPSSEVAAADFDLDAAHPARAELATEHASEPSRLRQGFIRTLLRGGCGRRSDQAVQAGREERIRAVLPQPGRVVACLSATGGVGATTITALLGQRWAQLRSPDPVVAVEAHGNGALARRTTGECDPTASMQHQGRAGVEVLSSEFYRGPAAAVSSGELHRTVAALRGSHALVVLDVGTTAGEVRAAALAEADVVVLVAGSSRDQTPPALDLLAQLRARHGLPPERVVVALGGGATCDSGDLRRYLAPVVRAVVPVPVDAALALGGQIPEHPDSALTAAVDEVAAASTDALAP